jgi:hypothetical protein
MLPASTLLIASSAVILPAPILKPRRVQYKEQHKRSIRGGSQSCISPAHISQRGMHLTGYHRRMPLIGVHLRHVSEGFYEDIAHQNTAAHLSQLQLGFRRCRIWVSVIVVVS